MTDVLIIGAGLAGLTAARELKKKNISFQILEAEDRVGGRIKTDMLNGYRLDRGFQVLLTAYPETKHYLDYDALKLKTFYPGAIILQEKGKTMLGDPLRQPASLLKTLFARVGTLRDKINILRLRQTLLNVSLDTIFEREEISTAQALKQYGFSPRMIEQFFKPFMGGIFLENDLQTSRRMFDFVFKMFSTGDTAVPALGMEEIPKQLAKPIDSQNILFHKRVKSIENQQVTCEDGSQYEAKKVLIATEANSFLAGYAPQAKLTSQAVTCVYFYADKPPLSTPILVLDARQNSLINNIAVMSQVAPDYAPQGKTLISVSINGIHQEEENQLSEKIKQLLFPSLGDNVLSWRLLKSYQIAYALPNQQNVQGQLSKETICLGEQLFQTGDHLLNGSINAALQAGRESALAVADSL